MIKNCYVVSCKQLVCFKCSCSDSIFSCENHLTSHLLSFGEHTPIKLLTRILDNQRQKIICNFIQNQKTIKNNIEKIKSFTQQLISFIEKESSQAIHKLFNEYNSNKNNLKLFLMNSLISTDIFENTIESKNFTINELNFDYSTLENLIIKHYNFTLWDPISIDDDYAIQFSTSSSSSVDLINLNNFKKTSISLHIRNLIESCVCCKIDSNKYFVYGGGPGTKVDSASIIDIQNNCAEVLLSNLKTYEAGGCFLKNDVYIFGGKNESDAALTDCKKFNISLKIWQNICPLPECTIAASAFGLKDKIYVTGPYIKKLYIYQPHLNKFIDSKFTLDSPSYKFLVRNWLVWFGRALFELDENENLISRQSISDSPSRLNSTAYFKRGKYLYFITKCLKLYRIDVHQKIIQQVTYG